MDKFVVILSAPNKGGLSVLDMKKGNIIAKLLGK
jgi:hypothetical protein